MNKLNGEGNFIHYSRNDFGLGVSKNRQKLINQSMEDRQAEYILRVDDDVILDNEYINKLIYTINQGYDLATGVTPFIGQSGFKRESRFIQPVGNKVVLDNEGNFIFNGDDFGMEYYDEQIIPIHHFRSCALIKLEVFDKVNYDSRLSKHGFREEEILSFKMIKAGYTLGVNTKAIAWHLLTPSGGERFTDSTELIKVNEDVLKEFTKNLFKEGDFLKEYNEKLGIKVDTNPEDIFKQTNLVRI